MNSASFLVVLALVVGLRSALPAAPDETDRCQQNLRLVFQAIQAYRLEHKDLPNSLAELVPRFLAERTALKCPSALHLGATSGQVSKVQPAAEEASATTYAYEFQPVPIPKAIAGGSTRTMREWKRLQMGLVGSDVPMVRCHSHAHSLNLSFGGRVYETPPDWEDVFSDVIRISDLTPAKLFARQTVVIPIRERDPATPAQLIDLSEHYNASLTKGWHGADVDNNLSTLPSGPCVLGGVRFDARGVIQLGSKQYSLAGYPAAVSNILVGLRCERLHFLHATAHPENPGAKVGAYVLRFADGRLQELPIMYGRHLLDWWSDPEKPGRFEKPMGSTVAWKGTNPSRKKEGKSVYLYGSTWKNPHPNLDLKSIDFVSAMSLSAPFLLAITLEPGQAEK